MNTRATIGLAAGALAVGLLAGLALGRNGDKAAETTGPGPTNFVRGVPVGYARTKAGATAAAAAYSRALAQTLGKGADERRALVRAISVPEREQALLGNATEGLVKIDEALGQAGGFARLGLLGQRISSFDSNVAKVQLWTVSVVAKPGAQGQSSWGAGEVEVRWLQGDWKLWDTGTDPSPDLVPALVGSPSPGDAFEKAASRFLETDDVEE